MKFLGLTLLALSLTVPAFAKGKNRNPASSDSGIREETVDLIRNVVAAAVDTTVTDENKKELVIDSVKGLSATHTGGGGEGPNHFSMKVKFHGFGKRGSAVVEETRGGSMIDQIELKSDLSAPN